MNPSKTRLVKPTRGNFALVAVAAAVGVVPLFATCAPSENGAAPDGGGGGAGGAPADTCPEAPARLAAACGTCHDPNAAEGQPDYTSPGLAARLIDQPATLACPNGQTKLVNPTRPPTGVLFERLTTTACYRQMPPLDAPPRLQLSDPDRASLVDCLKKWLTPQLP